MNAPLVNLNDDMYPDINPLAFVQGTPEWHKLRKGKITATDAVVIMGMSPWKTRLQLYKEKKSNKPPEPANYAQQRGIDLESVARELFNKETGWNMQPEVVINEWAMASLDGRDASIGAILEIKCPGKKDHDIALQGNVPDHYYAQLQHQMWVAGTFNVFYYSFDGVAGVTVRVKRDEEYIQSMIPKLYEFYLQLENNTPPEPVDRDYLEKDNDTIWRQCALKWKSTQEQIKALERDAEELKQQLIFLSGESNAKGAGISISQITRKGSVQYVKMPQLKGVDVEPYRSASSTYWKIM